MQKKLKGLACLYRSILQKRTKIELIDDLCSLMSSYGLHMVEERDKRAAGGHKKNLRYMNKKATFAYAFKKLRLTGKFTLLTLQKYLYRNHPDPDHNYWYLSGTNTWYTKLRKGGTL